MRSPESSDYEGADQPAIDNEVAKIRNVMQEHKAIYRALDSLGILNSDSYETNNFQRSLFG